MSDTSDSKGGDKRPRGQYPDRHLPIPIPLWSDVNLSDSALILWCALAGNIFDTVDGDRRDRYAKWSNPFYLPDIRKLGKLMRGASRDKVASALNNLTRNGGIRRFGEDQWQLSWFPSRTCTNIGGKPTGNQKEADRKPTENRQKTGQETGDSQGKAGIGPELDAPKGTECKGTEGNNPASQSVARSAPSVDPARASLDDGRAGGDVSPGAESKPTNQVVSISGKEGKARQGTVTGSDGRTDRKDEAGRAEAEQAKRASERDSAQAEAERIADTVMASADMKALFRRTFPQWWTCCDAKLREHIVEMVKAGQWPPKQSQTPQDATQGTEPTQYPT